MLSPSSFPLKVAAAAEKPCKHVNYCEGKCAAVPAKAQAAAAAAGAKTCVV